MPHSVDSSSKANSTSSDAPTLSTAPSSTNRPLKQTARDFDTQQSPAVTGFNFGATTTAHLPSTTTSSKDPLPEPSSPQMAAQRNGAVPAQRATMTEQGRRAYTIAEGQRRMSAYQEQRPGYERRQSNLLIEQIKKESPVIAELRTNVIIKDEFTLITSLSAELSARYHRMDSSIMVTLTHSSCLMIGGSFDPAYILTISTIPEYVRNNMNEYNTFMIQKFMSEILSVPAARGIIRYLAIPEDMLGTRGTTIRGHMTEADPSLAAKAAITPMPSVRRRSVMGDRRRSMGATTNDHVNRNASMKSVKSLKEQGKISHPIPMKQPSLEPVVNVKHLSPAGGSSRRTSGIGAPSGAGLSMNGTTPVKSPSPAPNIARPSSGRKSALKVTGGSDTYLVVPSPPPVPDGGPIMKIHKRKSFASMFKREKAA